MPRSADSPDWRCAPDATDVERRLLCDVITSKLPPGTQLTVAGACAEYEASEADVAAAFTRAARLGFMKRDGDDWTVETLTARQAYDILESSRQERLRAVELAAPRMGPRHAEAMQSHLNELMSSAQRHDVGAVVRAASAFNSVIYRASGDPRLIEQIEATEPQVLRLWGSVPGRRQMRADLMLQIIEAARSRDADGVMEGYCRMWGALLLAIEDAPSAMWSIE